MLSFNIIQTFLNSNHKLLSFKTSKFLLINWLRSHKKLKKVGLIWYCLFMNFGWECSDSLLWIFGDTVKNILKCLKKINSLKICLINHQIKAVHLRLNRVKGFKKKKESLGQRMRLKSCKKELVLMLFLITYDFKN